MMMTTRHQIVMKDRKETLITRCLKKADPFNIFFSLKLDHMVKYYLCFMPEHIAKGVGDFTVYLRMWERKLGP